MSGSSTAAASPEVVVRRMRWWDVAPVVALDAELFGDTAWSPALFWSELAGVPQTRDYLVATTGDGTDAEQIVAYGGLMTVARESTVQTLGVAPAWQRAGLGRRVLRALVSAARRRSATDLWLEVARENLGAQALYRAEGLTAVSTRSSYYGVGRDAVIMRGRLSRGPLAP